MCQLADMDYFKNLSDDDLTLAHSPLLRAAQLTLQYTQGNGSIELTKSPAKLFVELIPFYLFQIDHGAYSRVKAYPEGNWDVWLNVLNVEVENGAKEAALYKVFYSEPNKGPMSWRKTGPFYSCVLRPLSWAGLLSQPEMQNKPSSEKDYFKTPLWRSALKPETDRLVQPAQRH